MKEKIYDTVQTLLTITSFATLLNFINEKSTSKITLYTILLMTCLTLHFIIEYVEFSNEDEDDSAYVD